MKEQPLDPESVKRTSTIYIVVGLALGLYLGWEVVGNWLADIMRYGL